MHNYTVQLDLNFKHTSNFTLRGQLRRHQVLVRLQAHNKFFAVCVARVQWCTQVILKFKSSCTVQTMLLQTS